MEEPINDDIIDDQDLSLSLTMGCSTKSIDESDPNQIHTSTSTTRDSLTKRSIDIWSPFMTFTLSKKISKMDQYWTIWI